MATIGTFKKSGNEYTGDIVTLSVQAKGVRIVPDTNRSGDNAPSHRVYVGRAEIGAAWSKTSNEGRDYLGLKLDDPSFTAPIYANLFDDEGEDTFSLIWSQPAKRNGDSANQCPARRDPGGVLDSLFMAGSILCPTEPFPLAGDGAILPPLSRAPSLSGQLRRHSPHKQSAPTR